MDVKLLTPRFGTGFTQAAGDVVDVPADEAKRLFEGGLAEPVEPVVESAADRRPKRNATRPR
jgi:hypothetical protein